MSNFLFVTTTILPHIVAAFAVIIIGCFVADYVAKNRTEK